MPPLKIVCAGVTGFIGKKLIKTLVADKHHIIVLTRQSNKNIPGVTTMKWDGQTLGEWATHVKGSDAIINLSGEGVAAGRWTKAKKEQLRSSRINSTKTLIHAIEKVSNKPSVLINASAVGYYGHVPSGEVIESHEKGTGFLPDLCNEWEIQSLKAQNFGVRVVLPRIGIVLAQGGGALQKILPPFKMFVGGPLGSGEQWFPWIHRDDLVGIFQFALENKSVIGPINATAPHPLQLKEFCQILGKVMHRPSWAPVPAFVLRLALGEMSSLLLEGQKAVPKKLTTLGYQFKYPTAEEALTQILKS